MHEVPLKPNPLCPVCSSTVTTELSTDNTLRRMAAVLGNPPPAESLPPRQRLMRCGNCSLEFADPLCEPHPRFYEWLMSCGFTYPARRWEWTECARLLSERARQHHPAIRLLDVGAGSGDFLGLVSQIPGIEANGLEHSRTAVEECKRKGLLVELGQIRDLDQHSAASLDAVTLWHVVEHVANPVETLEIMARLLSTDGEIFFSVPISPMSCEHSLPDPFNEPPHHLTRWNLRSLRALGERLGLRLRIVLPNADSVLVRTLRTLVLRARRSPASSSRFQKAFDLLRFTGKHPSSILEEFRLQWRHPRYEGKPLPDVVLVILSR